MIYFLFYYCLQFVCIGIAVGKHLKIAEEADIQKSDTVAQDSGREISKGDMMEKSVEEITQELQVIISNISYDMANPSQESTKYINDLYQIGERSANDPQFGQQIAVVLANGGFVELFKKMWQKHCEDGKNLQQTDWFNLNHVLSVLRTMSEMSSEICEQIIKTKLHSDISVYLHLDSTYSQDTSKKDQSIVNCFLDIIYSVVQRAADAWEALRKCDTIAVLKPYRECDDKRISCLALMIQTYLLTEEDNERINSAREIREILNLLQCSMNGRSFNGKEFQVIDILRAINKLATNDSNKLKLVGAGALELYVKLLRAEKENEQKEAAYGLKIIGFKCKEDIKKESGCIEGEFSC